MRNVLPIVLAMSVVSACSSPDGGEPAPPSRLVASAGAAADHRTQATDVLPFPATETELANGLRVIVVPTGFPNLVSLQIPVQTGARNEVEPGKTGFAHFFEHMMFRGTKAYPPEAYQEIITRAGARQNAYTSDDYTNYHVTFAKEDLAKILEIEADRFQRLDYPKEAFETEAKAVLGEYNKNSANPIQKAIEVQREKAYSTHTYKHTPMGFLADIEDMPNQFAYSRTFFDRWYRPEYTTIVLVGDVDAKTAVPLVEKYFGSWKRGSQSVQIPAEPEPRGPVYAHVPWPSDTLPLLLVAFHGPAFSETEPDQAAMDLLVDLSFGPTSEIYQRLVVQEQIVDTIFTDSGGGVDPALVTIFARLKDGKDALRVRDEILRTAARSARRALSPKRVEDGKSNARYGFARTLDNSETIASVLARFVHYGRSYQTLNRLFRLYESLDAEQLRAAAEKYFTDARLVVTTVSKDPLPAGIEEAPSLASLLPAPSDDAVGIPAIVQKSANPQLSIQLLFRAGSSSDPPGREGLAALTASMIAEAGSRARKIDEILEALFPVAGSFSAQVDREMTVFRGSIHRDNVELFLDVALAQLLDPGFRESDFARLEEAQKNALLQDLRTNNDEELGKERLQANLFAGSSYGHPTLGTAAGLEAITLDDVRQCARRHFSSGNVTIGLAGDAPETLLPRLRESLASLGTTGSARGEFPRARKPKGLEIEIVQKETRATAISFGHPIEVTRAHPDFAALSVARAWLGEHRSSMSHLYNRIREIRGMNYGDYAYIEAFPRGMYQFFPDPNLARRAQIFEVWIRPVPPEQASMALRIALHEVRKLVRDGLSAADFEATRSYLMKNVFLQTKTQDQQLGYALDSDWYGIGEYTETMRERLAKLTREDVNAAIRKHLSGDDLSVVIVTKDAEGLRNELLSGKPSRIAYESKKPAELLAEDEVIGALDLGLAPDRVRITPVAEVFAR